MLFCAIASRNKWFFNPSKRNSFFSVEVFFLLLSFTLVFGARYDVGEDYLAYLENYLEVMQGVDWVSHFEWGFAFITNILANCGVHYFFYFSLLAFLQVFCIFYAFRTYKPVYPFLVLTLILSCVFLSLMNGMRQEIVSCLFLCTILFIDKKQPLRFYLLLFLAALFHKSALMLIIVYPIFRIKKSYFNNTYWQLILLLFALVLMYSGFLGKIFMKFEGGMMLLGYGRYYDSLALGRQELVSLEKPRGLGFLITLLMNIIIISYNRQLESYFTPRLSWFPILYNLFFIGVLLFYIKNGSMLFQRAALYLTRLQYVVGAFALDYLFSTGGKNRTNYLFFFVLLLLYVLTFIANFYRMEENTMLYTFFLQH